MYPTKSHFTENLVRHNTLSFSKWLFEPGMLFLSEMTWWGEKGFRKHRHNGLDLHSYAADDGIVRTLNEGMKVPLLFDGTIVRSIKDFLGYTFFVVHDIYDSSSQLFTVYGHLQPAEFFCEGKYLHEGDVFATMAGTEGAVVPAHIHLSLAFIPETIRTEALTWKTLDEDERILFVDPRNLI
jgi:hypothetical protein